MQSLQKLIGPFTQLLTLNGLPLKGPIDDAALEVISGGGILVENGRIRETGAFAQLAKEAPQAAVEEITAPAVCLPGFVDCHTHICFAGSRARDYAMRVAGKPYLEIARAGGGILESVRKTRAASREALAEGLEARCRRHLAEGVTTCEVKSGYALNVEGELKMLRAIQEVDGRLAIDLIATCLAAHMPPHDFAGSPAEYLQMLVDDLLPRVLAENLSRRIDIFIEDSAFSIEDARPYLSKAKQMGFSLTMHVDQFTAGGSALAVQLGAVSADHLEASSAREIRALANSGVIAVALPGASLGLGCGYAPARKLLNGGAALAIATDWNPGSAPMGDLLMQAAVLGASEKLTAAETLSGITFRAAAALELKDRGTLAPNQLADFIAFPCDDYREILYHQGKLKPEAVWKKGKRV